MKTEARDGGSEWRWVAIFELFLRLAAIVSTSVAVYAAMGKIFVVAVNGVACFYLLMSLPVSIFNIMRPHAYPANRVFLNIMDMVMVALVTAGALAAGIVYLVEKAGNARASWVSVWSQFDSSSCFAVLALILHVLLSGVILYKQALNIKFKKLDSVD
uniref:CASP-like protein 1 n=1 Tax=Picea sitchensis TaxID=3332 RepID=CSPL1_PICSI|nr:RecName: Full=CASP-like protein 1 [Picea sitchensis]ABK22922.1 unknown [Picea sitchensis]ABK26049.1 unknown [Picea sitchensis]